MLDCPDFLGSVVRQVLSSAVLSWASVLLACYSALLEALPGADLRAGQRVLAQDIARAAVEVVQDDAAHAVRAGLTAETINGGNQYRTVTRCEARQELDDRSTPVVGDSVHIPALTLLGCGRGRYRSVVRLPR